MSRENFPSWMVDRKYIEQDSVCAKCGNPLERGFHRHHKDGIPSNNDLDNLELLCVECHFTTFPENPLKAHKEVERKVFGLIEKMLEDALSDKPKITGAVMERMMDAFTTMLKISRQEKGLDVQMEYPSTVFTMMKELQREKLLSEIYLQGLKEGIGLASKRDV